MNKKTLKVYEAFAGIGAQKRALVIANIKHKIVGMAEWYVPAILTYQAIHENLTPSKTIKLAKGLTEDEMRTFLSGLPLSMNSKNPVKSNYWKRVSGARLIHFYVSVKQSIEKNNNIVDVRQLKNLPILPEVDLFIYSFPCQDISIQGKSQGIKVGTRSGLLLEIEKFLQRANKEKKLPKYLLMENVKAIFFKNHYKKFDKWIKFLKKLGYATDAQSLDSSKFGSPQRRERAFALSIYRNSKIFLPLKNNQPPPGS